MAKTRDDFTQKTKDILAKRAGMKCSICRRTTCGPHTDSEKSINMGVAAHITAAAPGGARYDASLTASKRKNINNGIWLCAYHASLVDKDDKAYTVESLLRDKNLAEDRAKQEQEASGSATIGNFPNLMVSHKCENVGSTAGDPGLGGISFILQSFSDSPITIQSVNISAVASLDYIEKVSEGFDNSFYHDKELPPPRIGIKLYPINGCKSHDGLLLEKKSTCRFFLPICNATLHPLIRNGASKPDLELTCRLNNGKEWILAYNTELFPIINESIELFKNMLNRRPNGLKINLIVNQLEPPDMSKTGTLNSKPFTI